jgi:GDPmannose 4,6-dehydratase
MKTNKSQHLAMVTGITGQDGSYLAELLLEKEYKVVGIYRRSSTSNFGRIQHLISVPNLILEECDLADPAGVSSLVNKYQPNEFYNLAAQSHVASSFKNPSLTIEINTIGVINILEAIRSLSSSTKFYQASTSEMFGRNYSLDKNGNKYQDENTELLPQSPYGVAKLASHRILQLYREAYGLFACSGILFNHESPRRGDNFVTKKITKYIGQLVNNKTNITLKLGNLNVYRDWGHAKDYVKAMYLMLQNDIADDFVISTGKTWSILDFIQKAFNYIDLDYKNYIEIDPNLYRPAEVEYLRGCSDKAKKAFGWEPEISFDDLVKDMIDYEINKENSYV